MLRDKLRNVIASILAGKAESESKHREQYEACCSGARLEQLIDELRKRVHDAASAGRIESREPTQEDLGPCSLRIGPTGGILH